MLAAFTARLAISKCPIRTSIGKHHKAARDQSTYLLNVDAGIETMAQAVVHAISKYVH